ncbi:stage III sporulation protein AF [Paenibacillus segetis]|uniref:Stage III sporulation protein AF n=1 Tax=Paenibacillus segetis TaxID=1325360 RepID=A0ABQ1YI57_9BACL|nr:stage III sporulation protein AF [Paenibacillus segetis]GGH25178.1 hypothetical protein GCM10008013_25290 [Paenibacillus segetis]
MTWISEWLKEIIFVVLIAVFIELLLPNKSMERYVKFVVSLLILLTILSPIIRLFSSGTEQTITAALSDNMNGLDGYSDKASTALILKQGEEIKKKRESESLQWAGEEAARQMKEQIERVIGQPVERVTVKLTTKPTDETAKKASFGSGQSELLISAVEVYMGQAMKEELTQSGANTVKDSEIDAIPSVEKVTINVQLPQDSTSHNEEGIMEDKTVMADTDKDSIEDNGSNSRSQNKAQDVELTVKVKELLYKQWGVSKDTVAVIRRDQEEH